MKSKSSILVVDDSRLIRVAARRILGAEYDVHEAEDGEVAWQLLIDTPTIDLVMSDLSMPNLDGLGLLNRIRESNEVRIRTLPVVIASGAEDDDGTKENAIARGASNFVTKPFDPAYLLTNIRTLIDKRHTARALDESRAQNQVLQSQTGTDAVTGFVTEQGFCQRGEEQLAFALRHQTHLALVGIHLEKYRVWYLRRGKQFAEKLLAEVARTVAEERRREDIEARLDPDDIAVLLPSCNAAGARQIAEKLRAVVEDRPYEIEGETVRVTVSIGVVCPTVRQGLNFATVLDELKASIKAAHAAGGGRVHAAIATPPPAHPHPHPRAAATPEVKATAVSEALVALRLNRPLQTRPELLVQTLFPLLELWARDKNVEIVTALKAIREAVFAAPATAHTAAADTAASREPVE